MLVSNARIVKTSIDLNVQISMDVGTAASSQGKLDGGSCQNYGPFLGTLNTRCRIILGTQKGTLILTTTHGLAGHTRESFGSCLGRAGTPKLKRLSKVTPPMQAI